MTTYLWCCVACGCSCEGVEFGMDVMEFADRVSVNDMTDWVKEMSQLPDQGDNGESDGKSKKKK